MSSGAFITQNFKQIANVSNDFAGQALSRQIFFVK